LAPRISASAYLFSPSDQTSAQTDTDELAGCWRTPTAQESGKGSKGDLTDKSGEPWTGEGRPYFNGQLAQITLDQQVYADARQWNTPRVGAANAPGGGGNPQSKEYPYRLENQVQEQTWPTPTTQETPHYEITLTATGRREGVGEGATSHSLNLCDAARLAEYAEMIADPSTPERIGAIYGPQDEAPGNTHGSPRASHPESRKILNPRWVEVLMGVPVGWVMATCDAPLTAARMSLDFWGMELCPPQQSEPLGCCGES
jgi:hypothetical protein